MNQKFCQKHTFTVTENGEDINIAVEKRPQESAGVCCGSGHCS